MAYVRIAKSRLGDLVTIESPQARLRTRRGAQSVRLKQPNVGTFMKVPR
jgi:hypothetical protein